MCKCIIRNQVRIQTRNCSQHNNQTTFRNPLMSQNIGKYAQKCTNKFTHVQVSLSPHRATSHNPVRTPKLQSFSLPSAPLSNVPLVCRFQMFCHTPFMSYPDTPYAADALSLPCPNVPIDWLNLEYDANTTHLGKTSLKMTLMASHLLYILSFLSDKTSICASRWDISELFQLLKGLPLFWGS